MTKVLARTYVWCEEFIYFSILGIFFKTTFNSALQRILDFRSCRSFYNCRYFYAKKQSLLARALVFSLRFRVATRNKSVQNTANMCLHPWHWICYYTTCKNEETFGTRKCSTTNLFNKRFLDFFASLVLDSVGVNLRLQFRRVYSLLQSWSCMKWNDIECLHNDLECFMLSNVSNVSMSSYIFRYHRQVEGEGA